MLNPREPFGGRATDPLAGRLGGYQLRKLLLQILQLLEQTIVLIVGEFRFADDEVLIRRSGGGVLLLPREITYERVMAAVGQFKGKFERQQPKDQKRKWR